jgi:N-acetylmuramoyl-L-alanine amidase
MKILNNRLVLDSDVPVRFVSTPNHAGPLDEKAFIIMHYTGGSSLQSTVTWFTDPKSQVSSHIVIGRDGEIVQMVPFDTVAWQAGASTWENYTALNKYSVGIELDNAGMLQHSGSQWVSSFGKVYPESEVLIAPHKSYPKVIYGWHKYTDIQIKAAARVAAELIRTYGFREILGHDDVAPKRKWDPGPAFPMEQFRLDVMALVNGQPVPPPPDPTPPPAPEPPPVPVPPQGNKPMRYKVENLDTGKSVEYTWSTAFKPVVLLPVPYVSQIGVGADVHHNDCGAASAIMLLAAYFNVQMTPDEFYVKFGIPGDPFLSVVQLRNAMGSLGLLTDFRATLSIQDLFGALAAGKPPIVLLRYKLLEEAGLTEKTFEGPHFAVVVGLDIKNIYIHDPLYTNPDDGNAHAYPLDIFWKAWKEVANDTKYPGPERGAIIPTAGIGFRLARTVKVNQTTLNIRSGPGVNFPVVGSAKKGEVFDVTREMSGWGEIGENRWFALTYTIPA